MAAVVGPTATATRGADFRAGLPDWWRTSCRVCQPDPTRDRRHPRGRLDAWHLHSEHAAIGLAARMHKLLQAPACALPPRRQRAVPVTCLAISVAHRSVRFELLTFSRCQHPRAHLREPTASRVPAGSPLGWIGLSKPARARPACRACCRIHIRHGTSPFAASGSFAAWPLAIWR